MLGFKPPGVWVRRGEGGCTGVFAIDDEGAWGRSTRSFGLVKLTDRREEQTVRMGVREEKG